ncbi:receptor-like protein 54 [Silene latifolia]|uniref:receptor-like protein 54 n=1 Tax=Silene latifolia TaxID=37657 RepID=UPI003D77B887
MKKQTFPQFTVSLFATYFFFISYNLVYAQLISHFPNNTSPHRCFKDDSIALLGFKDSFTLEGLGLATSWNKDTDCCKWIGITCHETTHRVTSIDLSSGGIMGAIGDNSTLFLLNRLESLNLAFNYFAESLISPNFGQFSYMKHLNLSGSGFVGQVPQELGRLSKLETLDLLANIITMPNFDMIISNMTGLRWLDLGYTKFGSVVFPSLTNITSLKYLGLFSCGLVEEIPFTILNLPRLEYLDVGSNPAIYSNFRLYNWSSPLNYLGLDSVNFSSQIPSSPGQAPYKLLRVIHLSNCNLQGEIPSWIWRIPKLEELRISNNQLIGDPSKFFQEIISPNLQILDLQSNSFTGNISLYYIYQRLPNLMLLALSHNNLTVSTRADSDTSLSMWPVIFGLALSSCNLNEIPHLLKNQSMLNYLDLSNNNLHGEIPKWLLEEGMDTLQALDLSNNFFTGSLKNIPWRGLYFIDLSSNMLHGSLPIPPTTVIWFAAANNNFSGPINPSVCDINFLKLLDLSNNSLGGQFPKCLGNTSFNLMVLNLGLNNIVGTLPSNFTKCSSLQYLDLSHNGLEGTVSRSLAGCKYLQHVNLRSNKFKDEFPLWLHNLPEIQVLDLSYNSLHGSISQKIKNPFPMLQILDLSSNRFNGEIPANYIRGFKGMMNITVEGRHYMGSGVNSMFRDGYTYSMVISIGGVERKYQKIITTLATLDVSNNGFIGKIPDCVGDLVMIHSLNLSHNKITGKIPSSLGNLKMINSLDLSANNFTGQIPQELASLTSMGVFNVSNNQLVGKIPHSNNFDTFQANSYAQNGGLCGFPLRECGQNLSDSWMTKHEHEGSSGRGLLSLSPWEVMSIGYGGGTLVGLAWGCYMLLSGNPFWVTKWAFLIETYVVGFVKKFMERRRRAQRLKAASKSLWHG